MVKTCSNDCNTAYRILVGTPGMKIPLWIPTRISEYEYALYDLDWSHRA
jgi:hypothetical protein